MSIIKENISFIIVTFKSDTVIDKCIESIGPNFPIIVVENSNDKNFKEKIEKKYSNVKCYLSEQNLGMGAGNNLGLYFCKTDFAFILNPDAFLYEDTIDKMVESSSRLESFAILAPICSDSNYPNYKQETKEKRTSEFKKELTVKSVDGFAMLFNIPKIKETLNQNSVNFFDENIFMYLENDDLCKRLTKQEKNIYVSTIAKIDHLGAKGTNEVYKNEIELSRNWHWIWSKFYYNKKHNGFLIATLNGLPSFFSSIIKFLFYSMINKNFKKKVYKNRCLGFINSLLNKPSTYRPEIQD